MKLQSAKVSASFMSTLLPKITRILSAKSSPGQEENPETASVPEAPAPEKAPIQPEKAEALETAMSVESVFESMLAEERGSEPSVEQASGISTGMGGEKSEPNLKGDPAAHEAAKRLARIIISDIALYNQRAIEEGIEKGTFHELLKEELAEGKKLYESRIPDEIRSGTQYLEAATEDFISKKKV